MIKDILEHLSATQKINNGWTSFSDKECKLLYDYITNLQQEIERLNNVINKALHKLRASKKHFKTERENNTIVFVIRILESDK